MGRVLVMLVIVVFLIWFIYRMSEDLAWEKQKTQLESAQKLIDESRADYKEFSSTWQVSLIWNDKDAVGHCSRCGMEDAPIIEPMALLEDRGPRCKWCAELEDITRHLELFGVRRLKGALDQIEGRAA